jgi:hypothetical protein
MNIAPNRRFLWIAVGLLAINLVVSPAVAKPSAGQTAKQVDRLLAEEVLSGDTQLAPRVDDATYLRRVWLDIVGDIPTPEHVTAFVFDPSTDKRQRVVRELLADPQYGQNWARYWRDVILLRRLEDRAAIVSNALVADLTEKFNRNEPWNTIAADFVTATGDAKENGAVAIQLAQDGRTEETAAEMSRVFLGIQIQCCQCHDHPYDSWKREQFHEFAAFFPRIAVRPVLSPTRRSWEVVSDEGRPRGRRPNADQEGRRGQPEHYMPDLENPAAPGTRMQPKFFLTLAELPFGTPDAERRGAAAKWMTENRWFATAFVNRIWGELVGEGFYEPVDDIGPEREASAPKAIEFLSRRFADSGYDVKWLLRVICATETYQRESRPRRAADGTPFTANVAQPLRSDQLYNALLTAAEVDESEQTLTRRNRPQIMAPYGPMTTIRQQFDVAFGYDPSDPRETVTSSIPQALAMMNGVRINLAIRAIGEDTVLGRLLDEIDDDGALVDELYLRTLSREATDDEREVALKYCRSAKNRPAAFEDLFWALLNSSEFSHRK